MRTLAIILVIGLFVAGGPAAAGQASAGELAYPDPKGDVAPFGVSTGGPTAATPLTDLVDLVSFRLYGEDQEALSIEIGVGNAKPSPQQLGEMATAQYETTFKLDGSTVSYRLALYLWQNHFRNPVGTIAMPATFCVMENNRGCLPQRVHATFDFDKNVATATISKLALMGQEPSDGSDRRLPASPSLDAGSRLASFRTIARGGSFGWLFQDVMPNTGEGGPYAMQTNAANGRIRVQLHQLSQDGDRGMSYSGSVQDFPQASVSPGTTSLLQVAVENLNAGKRIINLSAELVDPQTAKKWETRIVKTITVPGSERRIVNLIVNLTGSVEHRESALVRITARSLGFQDEIGVTKLRLVAAVPPSPTTRDLYFHGGSYNSGPLSFCFGCTAPVWINTLENDPKATGDDGVPFTSHSGGLSGSQYARTFLLDAPLNTDLVISPREPVGATLNMRASTPMSGTAKLELSTGEIYIGSGEAPWTGSGPVSISFQPTLESQRIPKGSILAARVSLTISTSLPTFIGFGELQPEFVPKGSKFTLPIIPDPNPPPKAAIPAGPAFLTLEVDGDTQEFVNPNKVKVFRLTVVNEGVQEDVVHLSAVKEPENWYVAFNPADQYRLKPGESATVALMVRSPAGAKEGDQLRVTINATSKSDPSALAQAMLTAVVTTGVEIDDESENFTADEDTISHVNQAPSKKSPGMGAFAFVAAAALAFVWRRRRSG